jgi:hypothetical protein
VDQVASEGYTTDEVPITKRNALEDKGMYILKQEYDSDHSNDGYVCANGQLNCKWGDSYKDSEGKINPNYVWQFERVADHKYALASMGSSGFYIKSKGISSGQIPLIDDNPGLIHHFTVEEKSNKLAFKTASSSSFGSKPPYYLYNAGNNIVYAYTIVGTYILYKVTKQDGSSSTVKAESTPTIPINIIDNRTGVASPLTSIKRNDFIEITVNASFNEQQGAIGFNTTNWQEGGGDVTFN